MLTIIKSCTRPLASHNHWSKQISHIVFATAHTKGVSSSLVKLSLPASDFWLLTSPKPIHPFSHPGHGSQKAIFILTTDLPLAHRRLDFDRRKKCPPPRLKQPNFFQFDKKKGMNPIFHAWPDHHQTRHRLSLVSTFMQKEVIRVYTSLLSSS